MTVLEFSQLISLFLGCCCGMAFVLGQLGKGV